MYSRLCIALASLVCGWLVSSQANAEGQELILGSKFDFFKLQLRSGSYFLDENKVDLGVLSEFLPLLDKELVQKCPKDLPERPDLRLKRQSGDQVESLQFFIEQKIIQKKDKCLEVTGQGIVYLPLHRSWFVGKDEYSLNIGTKITFQRKGEESLVFKKDDQGEWRLETSGAYVDFDFFSRFFDSLKKFKASGRAHKMVGKERPQFQIETQGKTYEFYQGGANLWGVIDPGNYGRNQPSWILLTDNWAFWKDLSDQLIYDRHAKILSQIADPKSDTLKRIESLSKLGNNYSKSIRNTLQEVLISPNSPKDLKLRVIRKLKQHPSDSNLKVFMDVLKKSEDPDVIEDLASALRIRNPKGPRIPSDLDFSEREKKINEWQSWWSKQ